MSQPPAPLSPTTSLRLITLQFPLLIVLLLVFLASRMPSEGRPQYTLVYVGLASLVVGVFYSISKLRPRNVGETESDLPPYSKFQSDVLVSLAFIELCALLGIFTSNDRNTAYIAGTASIVAILVFVYPQVERYCRFVSPK